MVPYEKVKISIFYLEKYFSKYTDFFMMFKKIDFYCFRLILGPCQNFTILCQFCDELLPPKIFVT